MVVQSPQPTSPRLPDDVKAGVIEDARRRQRRHRGVIAALAVAVLVAAGLIIGFSGGGGSAAGAGGGLDLGGAGAPVAHQALNAPNPRVVASAVRRCDVRRQAWNGIERPFATGPKVSAENGGIVALVSNARGSALLCMTGTPSNPYQSNGGAFDRRLVAPGPDQLTDAGLGGFGDRPGQDQLGMVAYDYGKAGSDVTAVEFIFRNRPAIQAVVHDGWYVALWPQKAVRIVGAPLTAAARGQLLKERLAARPTSVRVTTRTRTITSALPNVRCYSHKTACGVFDMRRPASLK